MPFKDSDYNRAYQRDWATKKRKAKLKAQQEAHPLGPLGWEGERLIGKWVRRGEYLLRKMVFTKQWQIANREELSAYFKAYYLENKPRIRAVNDQWTERNKTSNKAYKAQWVKDNPDKVTAASNKRRAHKANAPINDLTPEQWREIQAAYDHRCVYCGKRCKGKLTQDHITPLSKGGSHTAPNVIPACKSCNSRKHDKDPLCPVQPLLLTIAPSRRPKTA